MILRKYPILFIANLLRDKLLELENAAGDGYRTDTIGLVAEIIEALREVNAIDFIKGHPPFDEMDLPFLIKKLADEVKPPTDI